MTWRVAKVTATTSAAPVGTWRVTKLTATTTSNSWRVAKLTASTGTPQAVVLAPIADQTVNSFDLVTITAGLAAGSPAADAYRFTLQPNADVHSIVMTGSGNTRSFRAPGRMAGCDVVVLVEAISAGTAVASKTVTIHVGIHTDYIYRSGKWVAISAPKLLHAV